jgi:hypothetical protein
VCVYVCVCVCVHLGEHQRVTKVQCNRSIGLSLVCLQNCGGEFGIVWLLLMRVLVCGWVPVVGLIYVDVLHI